MQRPPAERSWDEVEKTFARAETLVPDSIDVALIRADYLLSLGKVRRDPCPAGTGYEVRAEAADLWNIRARVLRRYRPPADALKVLDEAIDAAGPQAVFFSARAFDPARAGA